MNTQKTETAQRKVPAAKIQFSADDRGWIAERIQEVLASGQLTLGKYGAEFEAQFAKFCGVPHAIAVNSGTSSLEIILRALDVQGQDVLVPTNTFFATAAAVVHAGGRPVLVDMDPESFAVKPEDVEQCLTPKTAGIIGLKHLERLPSMIADRQKMAVVYDRELKACKNVSALAVPSGGRCNYYKYIAVMHEARDRKALKMLLREQYGVSLAGEVYEEPLHKQPVFEEYLTRPMPVSEDYCARHLCLPVFSGMEEQDARQVIHALRETIG